MALLEEARDVEVVVLALEILVAAREHVASLTRAHRAPYVRTLAARFPPVEPGGDHGDPDLVTHLVVDDGAEDDVGVGMRDTVDDFGDLVDLEQPEVAASRD